MSNAQLAQRIQDIINSLIAVYDKNSSWITLHDPTERSNVMRKCIIGLQDLTKELTEQSAKELAFNSANPPWKPNVLVKNYYAKTEELREAVSDLLEDPDRPLADETCRQAFLKLLEELDGFEPEIYQELSVYNLRELQAYRPDDNTYLLVEKIKGKVFRIANCDFAEALNIDESIGDTPLKQQTYGEALSESNFQELAQLCRSIRWHENPTKNERHYFSNWTYPFGNESTYGYMIIKY